MTRTAALLILATTTTLLTGCSEPSPPVSTPDAVADRSSELTRRLLLIDTHIDVPYRLHKSQVDVSVAAEGGDFDFPRAVAGGLNALFMSIYIPADVDRAGEAKPYADNLIDSVESLVSHAPEKFAIATCTDDLAAIKAAGKIAFPMGMENGGPIEGSFENLGHFAERGIRYVTLAHSKSNHISDSSYDSDERWQGLSDF
ncbi:MAG: membrane dipeptidase, partial [Pseudomonadales bacterium]